MAVTPWASNFPAVPAAWQYSNDAGATWLGPPAPASQGQVAGPTGTQRYRQQVTIPAGSYGSWTVTVSGDIYAGNVNAPAHLYYDGVDQGPIPIASLAGPGFTPGTTFTLPVVPGAHTVEVWIGQAIGAGVTAPVVSFSFAMAGDAANPIPLCNCCPTGLTGCAVPQSPLACAPPSITSQSTTWDQQHATPDTVAVVANPAGASFGNPAIMIDKNPGSQFVINSGTGGVYDTQVTFRYSYTTPRNDIWGFSIWHGWGSVLNDGDGVGAATLTVYAGATVLFTGPITTGSGGQEFQTDFPSRLNGVTHFELSHIFGQGNVGVGIREVALNFPWRGTLTENCAPVQISGAVEATGNTFAAGLTLASGTMGQTNGPHTITWTVPAGVTGTITTNQPGDFSSLSITNGTVTTVTGNRNRTFSVSWTATDPASLAQQVYGMSCNGSIVWYDATGNMVQDPSIIKTSC